jgi:hypothetical protein
MRGLIKYLVYKQSLSIRYFFCNKPEAFYKKKKNTLDYADKGIKDQIQNGSTY